MLSKQFKHCHLFQLKGIIFLAHATQSHLIDDHPPAKPQVVDSEQTVHQLINQSDSEMDVRAVGNENKTWCSKQVSSCQQHYSTDIKKLS